MSIQIQIFQILVLCFNLVSNKQDISEIDILRKAVFQGSIEFVKQGKNAKVYRIENGEKIDFCTIKFLDNALYEITLPNQQPFKVDLAPIWTQITYNDVVKKKQTFTLGAVTINIIPGKANVYIYVDANDTVFVLPMNLIKKN